VEKLEELSLDMRAIMANHIRHRFKRGYSSGEVKRF
jgi:hypothetical protein